MSKTKAGVRTDLVLLRQSKKGGAIDNIAELCLGKSVEKVRFGGLVQRVVRHEAASVGVVAER